MTASMHPAVASTGRSVDLDQLQRSAKSKVAAVLEAHDAASAIPLIEETIHFVERFRSLMGKGDDEDCRAYVYFWCAKLLVDDYIPRRVNRLDVAQMRTVVEVRDIVKYDAQHHLPMVEDRLRLLASAQAAKQRAAGAPEAGSSARNGAARATNGDHKVARKPVATDDVANLAERFARLRHGAPAKTTQSKRLGQAHRDHPLPALPDGPPTIPPLHELESATRTDSNGSLPPPPNKPPPPVPGAYVERAVEPPAPIQFPKSSVLAAEELCKYLTKYPERILVLDVRSRRDFCNGHIKAKNIVCIEPVALRKDMNDGDIENTLIMNDKEESLFAKRDTFDLVVMYDGKSHDAQRADLGNMYIRIIMRAVGENAVYKPLMRPPTVLIGGFAAWLEDIGPQYVETAAEELYSAPIAAPPQPAVAPYPQQPRDITSKPYYPSRRNSSQSIPSRSSSFSNGSPHAQAVPYPRDNVDYVLGGFAERRQEFEQYPQNSYPVTPYPTHHQHRSSHGSPVNNTPSTAKPKAQSHAQKHPRHSYQDERATASPPAPVVLPPHPQDAQYYASSHHQLQQQQQQQNDANYRKFQLAVDDFATGLANLGNTCYMNCIIQCLVGSSKLALPFIQGSYRVNIHAKLGYQGVLAQSFAALVQEMFRRSGFYASPIELKRLAGRLREQFAGFEQQDCQEFLTFILDGLHEDLNASGNATRLKELTEAEERRREKMSIRVASTIEWERYLKTDSSLIVDTVQGQYSSRLKCLTCGFTSTTYNPFSFLSLPIPFRGSKRESVTLLQCFDLFTAQELLDGDNAWYCPHCKTRRRTSKKLKIARLPSLLIIHLKRFQSKGRYSDKLENFVHYPITGLDLTPYWPQYEANDESQLRGLPVGGQVPPFKYNLFAVANHRGTLKGGHYTAFVNRGRRGWLLFDDTRVSSVSANLVVNQDAYVLFYMRVN